MKSKCNTLFSIGFLLGVYLVMLISLPVSATGLNGDVSDTVNVNAYVKSYAVIDSDDIEVDEWIDYTGGDDFIYYLQGLETKGRLDDMIPTSDGNVFTGNGGEEKWAANYITMSSNVPFIINATATYLTGTSEEGSLNEQLTNTSDMVYYYLFPVKDTNEAITITPNGTDETSVGQEIFFNGSQTFILASKIKMPDNFWKVQAGTYTGTVTFTVEAYSY